MFPRRHAFRLLPGAARTRAVLCAVAAITMVAAAQTIVPETAVPEEAGENEDGGFLSGKLLRDGSILKNVVIPSYDAELHLTTTVSSELMTIVSGKEIEAANVLIRFFKEDRGSGGQIGMSQAKIRKIGGDFSLLTSDEPVSFVSDDLKFDGSALVFDTRENRGFLHGPVTAVAKNTDLSTSMNATPAHRALAAGTAMLMAAAPAQEAAPATTTAARVAAARLSQSELDRLAAEKASRAPQHHAGTVAAGQEFATVTAKAEDARITMNSFLQGAALAGLLAQPAPESLPDVPRPPALEDPKDTVVKSKNGAYFDSQEGILIFLGDVTVKNPELELSGASEVKVFMEPEKKEDTAATKAVDPNAPPKPLTPERLEKMKAAKAAQQVPPSPGEAAKEDAAAPKPADPNPPPTPEQMEKMKAAKGQKTAPTPEQLEKLKAAQLAQGLKVTAGADKGGEGGKFGDVKRMVATGPAVRIRYLSDKPGAEPIEASAHTIVYDFEKRTILLQGGSPWVYQAGEDGMKGQANGPEAYILVHTDENGEMTRTIFQNDGGGSTFNIKTPEKDDEKKDKPKQEKPKQEQPNR